METNFLFFLGIGKTKKSVYMLQEPKIKCCVKIAKELGVCLNKVLKFFPKRIQLIKTCRKKCRDCKRLHKSVNRAKLKYGRKKWRYDEPIPLLEFEQVKNISWTERGVRKRLTNKKDQLAFWNLYITIRILQDHYFDKLNFSKLFHKN